MGVAMYVFAIIYPLEKKHDLQLEAVALEEEAALLKKDIDDLATQYGELILLKEKLDKKFDPVALTKSQQAKQTYNNEVNSYQLKKDSLDLRTEKSKASNLRLKYGRSRLEVIQSQISEFSQSFRWLKFWGICLSCFGFFFWFTQTFWNKPKKQ